MFDWEEYIIFARHYCGLQRNKPCAEAYERIIMSRAYYGALMLSRRWLLNERGIDVPTTIVHKLVPLIFERATRPIYNEVAAGLRRLCDNRVMADYRDIVPATSSYSLESARDAFKVSQRISSLPKINANT